MVSGRPALCRPRENAWPVSDGREVFGLGATHWFVLDQQRLFFVVADDLADDDVDVAAVMLLLISSMQAATARSRVPNLASPTIVGPFSIGNMVQRHLPGWSSLTPYSTSLCFKKTTPCFALSCAACRVVTAGAGVVVSAMLAERPFSTNLPSRVNTFIRCGFARDCAERRRLSQFKRSSMQIFERLSLQYGSRAVPDLNRIWPTADCIAGRVRQ